MKWIESCSNPGSRNNGQSGKTSNKAGEIVAENDTDDWGNSLKNISGKATESENNGGKTTDFNGNGGKATEFNGNGGRATEFNNNGGRTTEFNSNEGNATEFNDNNGKARDSGGKAIFKK